MAKKRVKRSSSSKFKGISGWLMFILALFTAGLIEMLVLLFPRIRTLVSFGIVAYPGAFVSVLFILAYSFLLLFSIILIFKKKVLAKKISILAMIAGITFFLWFKFVGVIIFYGVDMRQLINGTISILMNLIIMIPVILYFLKSRRVKATLTRK